MENIVPSCKECLKYNTNEEKEVVINCNKGSFLINVYICVFIKIRFNIYYIILNVGIHLDICYY